MYREETFRVEEENTALHVGSGSLRVLATPWMIAFMERAARNLLAERLPDGYSSVGVQVDVRHLAPSPVGSAIRARAEVQAVEGTTVSFRVQAWDGAELIGEGQHQRAVIDEARFLRQWLLRPVPATEVAPAGLSAGRPPAWTQSRTNQQSAIENQQSMNLLVTGGAGYIGSATAEALIQAGHRVTVIDSWPPVTGLQFRTGRAFCRRTWPTGLPSGASCPHNPSRPSCTLQPRSRPAKACRTPENFSRITCLTR
jgi:predicted thioesterase